MCHAPEFPIEKTSFAKGLQFIFANIEHLFYNGIQTYYSFYRQPFASFKAFHIKNLILKKE